MAKVVDQSFERHLHHAEHQMRKENYSAALVYCNKVRTVEKRTAPHREIPGDSRSCHCYLTTALVHSKINRDCFTESPHIPSISWETMISPVSAGEGTCNSRGSARVNSRTNYMDSNHRQARTHAHTRKHTYVHTNTKHPYTVDQTIQYLRIGLNC